MDFNDFQSQLEQIEELPAEEKKKYYKKLLEENRGKTELRVYASFCYGQLLYQEGDFEKTIEIIEPVIAEYQSYPYTPKLLSCFNLIGVATHCEAEYRVSRFFYETALKIAKENNARFYYAYEYNNIALAYTAEEKYEEAFRNIELAEAVLKDCDEEMGAYVYVNKSIVLQKLGQLSEAQQAYETAVRTYHADEIVPDDVIRCAATLYYKLGQTAEYESCKQQILGKLDEMYAAEFMDVCKELFECAMDSGDEALMNVILQSMDRYMEKYPDEIKVGLVFAELKYSYAVGHSDKDAILEALEEKSEYKDRIIAYSMEKRVKSLEQYIEIHSQISDLELDALTGFRNRKAYYKDLDAIEQDTVTSMQPVGVIFADVNGLKKVNDSQGHEAGDELIASVAEAIADIFPDAKKYRFGGDEFVILSFDATEAAFQERVKRLAEVWKEGYSASIGSIWQNHAKDIEKSIAAADEMMYRDKNSYYRQKQSEKQS